MFEKEPMRTRSLLLDKHITVADLFDLIVPCSTWACDLVSKYGAGILSMLLNVGK
jgi:hypothetical protein